MCRNTGSIARVSSRLGSIEANGARSLIDFGPGYRVYYTQRGTRLLLLLAGGDKSTQQKDIAKAIELVKNFQE
ncbi:MAG: hypothetical protein H0T80_18255 [Betaproteobacteria bacterium]|nr:hypothetical protein [Betaproteobacteria bacterium]